MIQFDPSALRPGERCAVCGQLDRQLLRVYQLRGRDGLTPVETILCHHHAMPIVDLATLTADGTIVPPTRQRVLELWTARRSGRAQLVGDDRRHGSDRRLSRRGVARERRRPCR